MFKLIYQNGHEELRTAHGAGVAALNNIVRRVGFAFAARSNPKGHVSNGKWIAASSRKRIAGKNKRGASKALRKMARDYNAELARVFGERMKRVFDLEKNTLPSSIAQQLAHLDRAEKARDEEARDEARSPARS